MNEKGLRFQRWKAEPLQTAEKPRRAREGRSPLELSIEPSDMRGGRGLFSRREIPFPESEKRYLANPAPGDFEEILAGFGGGGSGGGASSPATGFSKQSFEKPKKAAVDAHGGFDFIA